MTIDVAIIGAGPAGITAAIYALRAGAKVTIFEKNIYGGQTAIIDSLENYPGFSKISGADFANALYNQVVSLGAEFVFSEVKSVDFKEEEKCISTAGDGDFYAKSVVIANGLKRRLLGCKGEEKFAGRGVSYCATCDGAFFKSKNVIVVGGGNTALEDALYLSNICKEVTLIVRKNYFRGEEFLVNAVNNTENINVMFESNITEICGEKFVTSVVVNTQDEIKHMKIDGVFIAIGYEPDNSIYENQIELNESRYFIADETCKTKVPGVYVAGDCRIKPLRQIATAIADGAVAGNSCAAFVRQAKFEKSVVKN